MRAKEKRDKCKEDEEFYLKAYLTGMSRVKFKADAAEVRFSKAQHEN